MDVFISLLKCEKNIVEFLGLAAGSLTTFSNIPQLIQLYRTRLGRDVSALMYVSLSCGLFLWIIYGVFSESLSIILTNCASLFTALPILYFKYKFRD
jgi:MtN3 and saliva related transmembrane protein